MIDFSTIYIYSDQPTTCPKCMSRSEIILDLSHTKDETQVHRCNLKTCSFEFVMQYDDEIFNYKI